jgi:predicted NAD/FAD-binding protein
MRIAIVGTGVSGLTAAHVLSRRHDVTVFEANDYVGGHTHTVDVELGGQTYGIDTGFIVHNDRTYPNFEKLLRQLGVERQPTSMGFSVTDVQTGLEFNASTLAGLFAQRRNMLNLAFYKMLADMLLFFRRAKKLALTGSSPLTIDEFLELGGYGPLFREKFLMPMMAAIWSASTETVRKFPACHFMRFFENHGLLNVRDRPQWYTVQGGSRTYVDRIVEELGDRVRTQSPVTAVRRDAHSVEVTSPAGPDRFDEVVFACHSDQALASLSDPTPAEAEVLGRLPFLENDVVLHTDDSLLPTRRSAWASWNYYLPQDDPNMPAVTYNMNMLQGIEAPVTFCVTLNRTEDIDPARVVRRFRYSHPQYSPEATAAQERWGEVSGVNRTHYCGAYWGYGFHEDGVTSALRVCEQFGEAL